MAEFEGNLNLNVETSEIEIKGKFKLTESELDKAAGGGPGGMSGIPPCVPGTCAHFDPIDGNWYHKYVDNCKEYVNYADGYCVGIRTDARYM